MPGPGSRAVGLSSPEIMWTLSRNGAKGCRAGGRSKLSPVLPLVGADTRFQPVWVEDVAEAAARGACGEVAPGTYELGGPRLATLRECMELMLRISAPVVVISMLVLLAMGFITKSMPALNILSVGFAMKIVASIAVLVPAVGLILSLCFGIQEETVAEIRRWALSLGS